MVAARPLQRAQTTLFHGRPLLRSHLESELVVGDYRPGVSFTGGWDMMCSSHHAGAPSSRVLMFE